MVKLIKKMFLILVLGITVTSCGVSACDCSEAAINNDNDVWKECQEKMSKMSYDEKVDFQNLMVKCANP